MIRSAGVIGLGRAGSGLVRTLRRRAGIRVLWGVDTAPVNGEWPFPVLREITKLQSFPQLVLVCTPERVIPGVLEKLAALPWSRSALVAHVAGTLNLTAFAGIPPGAFAGRGMLHPLYSFDSQGILPEGTWFGLNGDQRGLAGLKEVVAGLGGREVLIPEQEAPFYHLLAVLAGNFGVALAAVIEELLEKEIPPERRDQLRDAFVALLQQSVGKLAARKTGEALTGPAARGDAGTMEQHFQVLERLERRDLQRLYLVFSRVILRRRHDNIDLEQRRKSELLLEEYARLLKVDN